MAGEGGGQKYPKKDPHGLKLKMTPNLEANLLIQFLYSYWILYVQIIKINNTTSMKKNFYPKQKII